MADRFLPADDPVLEEVLNWTVDRDAKDIRRLLQWLPQARSSKERRALLSRVHELLGELIPILPGATHDIQAIHMNDSNNHQTSSS